MTGPSKTQQETVYDRADGRCEICRGEGQQFHHRRPRGMGGSDVEWINDPSNLILLCRRCHAQAESNRAEAYDRGVLVRYADEPWAVPAILWCGRVWLGDCYQTRAQREAS